MVAVEGADDKDEQVAIAELVSGVRVDIWVALPRESTVKGSCGDTSRKKLASESETPGLRVGVDLHFFSDHFHPQENQQEQLLGGSLSTKKDSLDHHRCVAFFISHLFVRRLDVQVTTKICHGLRMVHCQPGCIVIVMKVTGFFISGSKASFLFCRESNFLVLVERCVSFVLLS